MTPSALRLRLLVVVAAAASGCGSSSSEGTQTTSAGPGGSSGASGSTSGAAGSTSGAAGSSAGTGGTSAGAAGTTGGNGGTSAGAAGTTGGNGGAGQSGAAGQAGGSGGLCPPTVGQPMPKKLCFTPMGVTTEPLSNNMFEGIWSLSCPSLVRDPSAPCPPVTAVCTGSNGCSIKAVEGVSGPTAEGENCCYESNVCIGPTACGRPLLADGLARVARAVATSTWG